MNPPKWAQEMTLKALLWWEAQGNKAPIFRLDWGRRSADYSSGVSWDREKKIFVRQGTSRLDARLVLLHEVAHQLQPRLKRYASRSHTSQFWSTAWALYRYFKLPIRYCLDREGDYKVGAVVAYHKGKGRREKP